MTLHDALDWAESIPFVIADAQISDRRDLFLKSFMDRNAAISAKDSAKHEILNHAIRALLDLPEGWDGYAALPPGTRAAEFASAALDVARKLSFLPTAVIAASDGGIALCWDVGAKRAYLEIDNDETAVAVMYEGKREPEIVEFDPSSVGDDLEVILDKFRRFMAA